MDFIESELEIYEKGQFQFRRLDSLSAVCNAPRIKSGVYVLNVISNENLGVIYIGSSGKMQNDGNLKTRNGGLWDRLVNGKQFDRLPRRKCWPIQMERDSIEIFEVNWYVTFDDQNQHIPSFVEGILIQKYFEKYRCLPLWNKEY
jgi:hypothetical protein